MTLPKTGHRKHHSSNYQDCSNRDIPSEKSYPEAADSNRTLGISPWALTRWESQRRAWSLESQNKHLGFKLACFYEEMHTNTVTHTHTHPCACSTLPDVDSKLYHSDGSPRRRLDRAVLRLAGAVLHPARYRSPYTGERTEKQTRTGSCTHVSTQTDTGDRQAGRQAGRQTVTDRQKQTQTGRDRQTPTSRNTERQTDRLTD